MMQVLEFKKRMSAFPVFSLQDLRKGIPEFSYRQLDRWEKKGYIRKIRRGFYCFADLELNEPLVFFAANKIYTPSYVSLEKALKYYGLIPEEVFQITSVGTKKTARFFSPIGNFSYRHIKTDLFWGYRLMEFNQYRYLLAEPEKALLDYLYLMPHIKTTDDVLEMRVNSDSFREKIDINKLELFYNAFDNKALVKRTILFLDTILYD